MDKFLERILEQEVLVKDFMKERNIKDLNEGFIEWINDGYAEDFARDYLKRHPQYKHL